MERKPSLRKGQLTALRVDDIIPPFLAKKLELCRQLDNPSPALRVKGGDADGSFSQARRVRTPDDIAAAIDIDPDVDNLRKKDAFLRTLFSDTKLNHRQKEYMAANILIGKSVDADSRPPVFSQPGGGSQRMSPLRTGNIITDGHKNRHIHNHRSVELVGDSVEIKTQCAKEMHQKEVQRRHAKEAKPSGYAWANEFISAVPPYKVQAQRSFEGVQPSANREYIIDAISEHNRVKAKRNADQVRNLKATAMQEKSQFGNETIKEVSIKKKLAKFRKKLHVYLQKKGDAQRGDIMRCIDEETIYTFMENFKGYSMSPEVILSLLGTSLGSAMSEGVLLLPDAGTHSLDGKSGFLPVQTSHQELNPHLREMHKDVSVTNDVAHLHGFAGGFSPHNIPPSYSTLPSSDKAKANASNGFKVIPRPISRMGSGFMVNKTKNGNARAKSVYENSLVVAGAAVSSPGRGTAPALGAEQSEEILIAGGQEAVSSTWVTEVADNASIAPPETSPIDPTRGRPAVSLIVADPRSMNDSFNDSDAVDGPADVALGNAMRIHMAKTGTLPSLLPEKILSDEELLGLGKKTMTFEEIALKRERAALLANKAKKPVTGLAGLRNGKGPKPPPHMSPDAKAHIPRFIRTPQSGGEDFFPKSPSPVHAPVEHFSDD